MGCKTWFPDITLAPTGIDEIAGSGVPEYWMILNTVGPTKVSPEFKSLV
jgi:hypothetical protein